MQVYDFDASGGDGSKERWCDNVHPAGAYDEVGAWLRVENDLREVGVVLFAGCVNGVWMLLLVWNEVVVCCWY